MALERGDQKIACEISVTTTSEQELDNIQKCVVAGYAAVVALAGDAKTLRKLQSAAEAALNPETLSRVRFLQPEEFITYLDELAAAEASRDDTVRGYKVSVKYKPVSKEEAEARRQAISKVVTDSLRRGKKGVH